MAINKKLTTIHDNTRMHYESDISREVRWFLEANNFYFGLSDEEIDRYVALATKGADLPEEESIERIAHLAAETRDEYLYWAAVECQWGYACRNSIKTDEDVERKGRLRNIFISICPCRDEYGGKMLQYSLLVKCVLGINDDNQTASILAFGIYLEMESDYLFWDDLYALMDTEN